MNTDTKPEEKTAKAKRQRSPNYPFYGIDTCVEFLKKFIKNNKGFSKAHMDYAKEHMGFTAKSTRGNRAISSMVGYGLFDSDGSGDNRSFWPSDLAKKIFQDNDNIDAIQQATLTDSETRAVYERFGEALPGRGSLEKRLMTERAYSEEGAKRFAYIVQENYDYAQLARLKDRDKLDEKGETSEAPRNTRVSSMGRVAEKQETAMLVIPEAPQGIELKDGSFTLGDVFVYMRVPKDLKADRAKAKNIKQMIDILAEDLVGKTDEE